MTTQKCTDAARACPDCNGFGEKSRLMLSMTEIEALVDAGLGDRSAPVAAVVCKTCFGSGVSPSVSLKSLKEQAE